MKNKKDTLCWNCSKVYQIKEQKCPGCSAANAMVNLDKAIEELNGAVGGLLPYKIDTICQPQ